MSLFNGAEGDYIKTEEAQKMIRKHRGSINSVFFGKEKLQEMLNQAGSIGLRIYFARSSDNKNALVIAATDKAGGDITTLVLDKGRPCPPSCGPGSVLRD